MIEILPNWHPMLIHFAISLLFFTGAAQIFICIRSPGEQHPIHFVMKWLVVGGAISVIAAVGSGFHAYESLSLDGPAQAEMMMHRNYALGTTCVFLAGAIIYLFFSSSLRSLACLCFILALLLVTITGFHGGELVFRHGLGVMPQTDLLPESDAVKW
ncbi:hypothetical protein VA7868_04255 [Vibrio aerogenes CECT 7868]|uniref:DUF2231 domain-containing protein n=1 Tax=Vibrio aerogenes CECT 7868 TaxID=1216006 RepID=A0A1M6DK92_9VIBR|nr:DUF2231 domain-containing protein [Vibrio aerogenes]SHI73635.1 hypothetical protein VA7868_04255 [Vibrio aerogenes CECT 7868]